MFNGHSYAKFTGAATLVAVSMLTFGFQPAVADVVEIDFDDLAPLTIVTDQYADKGITFALSNDAPIAGPETYALIDSNEDPVTVCGAELNVLTAGKNPLSLSGSIFDIEMSFAAPIDYLSILVLDAEEQMTMVGYRSGQIVASTSNGPLICDYPGTDPGGYSRGPVYLFTLGTMGGGQAFDRVVLQRVGGDMPERFDNLKFNVQELHVAIDVKPGNQWNCVQLDGKGVVHVVVFGNEGVDVSMIDLSSLALEGMPIHSNKKGDIHASYTFIDNDEFLDLKVAFTDDGSLDNFSGTAMLEGNLYVGSPISGTDMLRDTQFCRGKK